MVLRPLVRRPTPILAASLLALSASPARCQPARGSCSAQRRSCVGPTSQEALLAHLTDSSIYDKDQSANEQCGIKSPVTVQVQYHVVYLDTVDQLLGQVAVGGYLRQWWKDPRLAYNTTAQGGCIDSMQIPPSADPAQYVWIPHIFIDNLVRAENPGSSQGFWIYPDGSIWWSQLIKINIKASMTFMKLPFDTHNISVIVASYTLDNSIVRVVARGGTPGEPVGGIGITSERFESATWQVEGGASATSAGMSTQGLLATKFNNTWDYVSLRFEIARNPDYFIEQVLVQDVLFLGVSYAGFYVNPANAPARASMAVIPVLIMRTLANGVFSGLPQISYSMWLADYLQVSMGLCVLCVIQFAVTQYCLHTESRGLVYYKKLRETEGKMRKLLAEARGQGMSCLDLVESLKLVEKGDYIASWNYVEPEPEEQQRLQSAEAKGLDERPLLTNRDEHAITEATIGVLDTAKSNFNMYDKDGSGMLAPHEIRKMLVSFHIYMHTPDCAQAMCKFLRDRGQCSPKDEMKAELRLGEFVEFLYDIDDYLIAVPHRMNHPFSHSLPMSMRLDIFFQWFFPAVVLVKILVFIAMIGSYTPSAIGA